MRKLHSKTFYARNALHSYASRHHRIMMWYDECRVCSTRRSFGHFSRRRRRQKAAAAAEIYGFGKRLVIGNSKRAGREGGESRMARKIRVPQKARERCDSRWVAGEVSSCTNSGAWEVLGKSPHLVWEGKENRVWGKIKTMIGPQLSQDFGKNIEKSYLRLEFIFVSVQSMKS